MDSEWMIRPSYLVDQVLSALQERLRDETFKVGERLPSELTLAKQFGVGRSTIREALRVLSHLGLVQTWTGRGTFVVKSDLNQVNVAVSISPKEVADIIAFRYALEVEAAHRAAEHRSEPEMENIRRSYDNLCNADYSAPKNDVVDLDFEFHLSIIKASGNKFVEDIYQNLRPKLIPAVHFLVDFSGIAEGPPVSGTNVYHSALVAAIERQDPRAAVAEVRRDHHEAVVRLRIVSGGEILPTESATSASDIQHFPPLSSLG